MGFKLEIFVGICLIGYFFQKNALLNSCVCQRYMIQCKIWVQFESHGCVKDIVARIFTSRPFLMQKFLSIPKMILKITH